MLFNSYIFIFVFLPISVIFYFLFNKFQLYRFALLSVVVSSFIFYAYNNIKFLPLLVISILFNWFLSKQMQVIKSRNAKKGILLLGILVDVILIFYFKYLNFTIENINYIFKMDIGIEKILLPLGISFFTFQQISYLVDSFRGETGDYEFIEYVAFVSFYPKLVSGPIAMHSELIPQFRDKNRWTINVDNCATGIYIFSIGLAKKILLANTFSKAVNWGWANIAALSSMEIFLVMLSYTFQIYFDFSGYCDMARGIAKLYNIELPINFNSPYIADSINEFWKRWHMTLTRFLRNYIYIPLGGNKKGKVRTYINTIIVFLISGIWHGANWTFIIWGGLHGIAQVLNRIFKQKWDKFHPVFKWGGTFLFVNVCWLIFRADNIAQAMHLIVNMIKMQTFTISEQFVSCFIFPEIVFIINKIPYAFQIWNSIYGANMWGVLLFALYICLNKSNMNKENITFTVRRAIFGGILMAWSVLSLTNISEFLYFNF